MRAAASILVLVYVSVLAALGCGYAFAGLNPGGAAFSLLAGVGFGLLAWWKTKPEPAARMGLWDGLALGAFALASLRAFLWVIYTSGDSVLVLSPNNLGDMSLHLNFIRYLASGVPFWPESPMLTGVPLSYPLGADLFNSLFEVGGLDTYRVLVWTALGGAALTGYLLWRWGGAFTVAAFLFNGGLAGFVFLKTLEWKDYQAELVWKNFFLAMFVTQRGLLVAIPAGLLLLIAWREAYLRSGRRFLPWWLQWLLYALMPFFNFHAFLFLSVILLALFLTRAGARKELVLFVAAAFVPATVSVLLITAGFSSGGITDLWKGIMENQEWMAWVTNFGLTLPLAALTAILLVKDKDAEARTFVWTGVMLFVVCCVMKFAPWTWDNMKLVLWGWLALAPYLWSKVLAPLPISARVALCLALFFSGFISLIGGLGFKEGGGQGYPIATRSELADWQHALRGIPPTARFATVPDFNNPIFLLGHKVVCDYEGHLWSHGLKYQDKLAGLKKVLAREPGWENEARELGADYIVFRTNTDGPGGPEIYDVKAGRGVATQP